MVSLASARANWPRSMGVAVTLGTPGGRFFVSFSGGGGPLDIARIGANRMNLLFLPELPVIDQCERTLAALFRRKSLLIYDCEYPLAGFVRLRASVVPLSLMV